MGKKTKCLTTNNVYQENHCRGINFNKIMKHINTMAKSIQAIAISVN